MYLAVSSVICKGVYRPMTCSKGDHALLPALQAAECAAKFKHRLVHHRWATRLETKKLQFPPYCLKLVKYSLLIPTSTSPHHTLCYTFCRAFQPCLT
jgi:hypothetical protein